MNQALFTYIEHCPTPYQAVAHTAALLCEAGAAELGEQNAWRLEPGKTYYVTRNGSSLIAFRLPEAAEFPGFLMTAAHCDSPCFKLREDAEAESGGYVQLSAEKYGGILCASWMDRPLSAAGRVLVRTDAGVESRLCDLREPVALIPNVAIHMNRKANDGMAYNAAVDLQPLYGLGGSKGSFRTRIAEAVGADEADVLASDLFLYNPQPGVQWGELISAPRLDDLQCAFASLTAFLRADPGENAAVYCLFDNEEVGSETKQGAASTFLRDVLERISAALGGTAETLRRQIAGSFLVSCDNAHAVHPNHPEYGDKTHPVRLNGGVVLKHNAAQRYTTDAVSGAVFRSVCAAAGVPVQDYVNRPDIAGGSTLGNIANTQVSLNTADIGLGQLAMHSAFETAGAADTAYLVRALKAFFETPLRMERDGVYRLA